MLRADRRITLMAKLQSYTFLNIVAQVIEPQTERRNRSQIEFRRPATISKTITCLPYLRPFKNLTLIMPKAWDDYLEKNKDRFLNEMLDLLRIPSVSAKGEHKDEMQKCAELVKQRLLDAGCDKAEVIET